ncbi:MAG: hypothetical protein WBV91_11000, partial [Desulfobacterales bacterium]
KDGFIAGGDGLEKGDINLAVRDQTLEGVGGFTNLISSVPPHRSVVLPALDNHSDRTGTVEIILK